MPQPAPTAPLRLSQLLAQALTLGLDRLDAQLLLLHALGRDPHDRAWLAAHDQDTPPPEACARFAQAVQRRAGGEPLAYLTGQQEFYGLNLQVDARVLIPRADTETLVDWALEVLRPLPSARVIDLGTGSGAIALALKATRADLQVHARDYSADALAVARANAHHLGLDIVTSQGSWLEALPVETIATAPADASPPQFHAIVSNPPYVAEHDPHLDALTHEPQQALTSGNDGLDDLRRIIQQAPAHLFAGGWLLLEHGYDQADAVCTLLRQTGFTQVQSRQDLAGVARCSGGQWQAPSQ